MSELIKRSEDWLDYHKGAPWETDAMKLIAELVKRVKELEQQLQHAHREGWEQCQKAAIIKTMEHHQYFMFGSSIPTVCRDIAEAIAAMDYKEKAND
jgi:hypothetical protein